MSSLRHRAGALVYDVPRFVRAMAGGLWIDMRNRDERVTRDARGVRCEWEFTSDLHIAKVFPSTGAMLMRKAFAKWPIVMRDGPERASDAPDVAFVIGHRGLARLPHLLTTLRSIAGQRGAAIECVVVEQDREPLIERELPPWVRYVFTPCDTPYNRSATLNAGVAAARAPIVILHDNDMVVPAAYAAECVRAAAEGWEFFDLKRFIFYLGPEATDEMFRHGAPPPRGTPATVTQNAVGASIGARRDAYLAAGGFDEEFIGWGGEDNEFWERAEVVGRKYAFGYLPFIHLWHAPQPGKADPNAPAVRRYYELRDVAPRERITRLLNRRSPEGAR